MSGRETGAWRDWLRRQRWYGDKSRPLDRIAVDVLTTLDLDGEGETATLSRVTCTFDAPPDSTYLLATLSSASGTADEPVDAFAHPALHSWLYAGFGEARVLPIEGGGTLRWIPGAVPLPDRSAPEGKILAGEQSNTSIRFGDEAILKVFRRLHSGINPDPEILRFLSGQTTYRHAPPDLGTMELHDVEGERIVIGAMQGFVPNLGDAWTWLLARLRAPEGGDSKLVLDAVDLLGRRTAGLHLALARGTDDPAFSVERLTAGRLSRMQERWLSELDLTLDRLRAGAIRDARQLGDLRDALVLRLETGDGLVGIPIFRIHGDFHLGQVLRTSDDFVIIDFEGEPSRPFAERREKASPLRDVAGMLRSIDYAVATVGSDLPTNEHGLVERFGSQAGRRFIGGYAAALAEGRSTLLPDDMDALVSALDPFLIEKALYEVRYELDNRPGWVGIPLRALETLAAA